MLPHDLCQTYLPLGGHVSVTSGDANKDCIIGGQNFGRDFGVLSLGRGVHLGQNFAGEGLWHSMKQLNCCTGMDDGSDTDKCLPLHQPFRHRPFQPQPL